MKHHSESGAVLYLSYSCEICSPFTLFMFFFNSNSHFLPNSITALDIETVNYKRRGGFLTCLNCLSLQVPSMRQLHLHVISQDFNSNHLKNKKHWNSFNTAFFRDSVDVIEEIKNHGKATIKDEDCRLSMELRCHRCRSAHPNIPRLKSHISICQAPFPHALLENGRLVLAPKHN